MSFVHLVITLPGLLRPPDAGASLPPRTSAPGVRRSVTPRSAPCPAPHLAHLLAAAGEPVREPDGIGVALAKVYGIARQADWPLAAIRLESLGIDAGAHYWLAADPVTLVAGRDDVRLAGAVADLAAGEAAALIAMLNAHFAEHGLMFVAPRPGTWFVRVPAIQAIAARPPEAVIGRTLRGLLASGPDAGKWRRWQNEVQMLLHEHPVNMAREARALPPANSVWFWGGGTRPPASGASIRTFADGGIAGALAAHLGEPARPLPAALDPVLAAASGAATAVIAFDPPLDLAAIERAWAAPAWAALGRGAVTTVTLIADGDYGATAWTARRPDAWRRLRGHFRAPDLATLLAARPDSITGD